MSRIARTPSSTGIYHAILRGINKQQIFECHQDYLYFEDILRIVCGLDPLEKRPRKHTRRRKGAYVNDEQLSSLYLPQAETEEEEDEEKNVRHCYIYAYCMMGNHVHLLIKGADEEVGDVMKRISSSYVYYYNHKYDRIGHLFQERYKSQPVEDWDYFLTLLRYIHQNPLKPQMVKDLRDYPWSSWNEYINHSSHPFCSLNPIWKRISPDELNHLVYTPLKETEEEELLDYETKPKKPIHNDADVWKLLTSYCGATTSAEFQALERPYQKHVLFTMHEEGVPIRMLSRLTGVSYSFVQKASNSENEWRYYQGLMAQDEDPSEQEYTSYLDPGCFERFPEW